MSRLLDCSHEVLQNILTSVHPADLSALSKTCHSLDSFVKGNKLLCKALYLQQWDYPASDTEPDWETELRRLVKLEKVFSSSDEDYKRDSLPLATDLIPALLSVPHSSLNPTFLATAFKDPLNIDCLLARSSLYQHAGTKAQVPAADPALRQAAAKLHTLYGIPIDHPPLPTSPTSGTNSASLSTNFRSPYHILYPHRPQHPHATSKNKHEHYTRASVAVRVPANNMARAKVYNLDEYTMKSLWGPFKGDGSMEVDWEKMEAVMVLLGYNLRLFSARAPGVSALWYGPWEGVGPNTFRSPVDGAPMDGIAGMFSGLRQDDLPRSTTTERGSRNSIADEESDSAQERLDEQDPYGITGTWMRVVCFLDYNDLYAFNFTQRRQTEGEEQNGIDTREAIRLIKLKLNVTRVIYPGREEDSDSSSDYTGDREAHTARMEESRRANDSPMKANPTSPSASSDRSSLSKGESKQPQPNKYLNWPVVYFTGTSRSLHASWDPNANSRIRGMVRMTRHGDVRWTTWSIFHGEERWRSEGVQVGGPKSARGVLGNWFDKDYERHGPAGPTAFWKVSDAIISDGDDDPLRPFLYHYPDVSDDSDDDASFDADNNPERPGSSEDGEDFAVPEEDGEGNGEDRQVDVEVEVIDEEIEGVEMEMVTAEEAGLVEVREGVWREVR